MNIIPFDYQDKPVRVIQDEAGVPWWVAKDVCSILGIVNPRDAISALDDDERNTVGISDGIRQQRGNPNVNVINEPGLYTLIIRSNKPEAKPFKRWITHEVLPSIRKTGRYEVPDRAEALGVLRRHKNLKKSQRIRLLELAYKIGQMDNDARKEMFDQYNTLCEAFEDRRPDGRSADARLIDDYLRALMDEGPVNRGFEAGTDAEGNPYFLATTGALVKALKDLGRDTDLPPMTFSDVQFGARFMRNRVELRRLGWVRSDRPGKIVRGERFFRYSLVEGD